MKEPIEEAVVREFTSPLDNKSSVYIEEFYFVCSGKINQDARDYICELLRKNKCLIFEYMTLIVLLISLKS